MPQQLRFFLQNLGEETRIVLIYNGKVVLKECEVNKVPYLALIDYQDYMVHRYYVDRGVIVFELCALGYSRRMR